MIRRPQRDHREPVALVHAEQRPLAHGLVADVGVGMIIGRQRVTLVVIQAVAVGGHARHEDVAPQPVAARACAVASTCAAVVPRCQS